MDDLTMTRLTATAMGFEFDDGDSDCLMVAQTVADMKAAAAPYPIERTAYSWFMWNPLEDDLQAMALVKRFKMGFCPTANGNWCGAVMPRSFNGSYADDPSLNRAIVLAVAKMQFAKNTEPGQ